MRCVSSMRCVSKSYTEAPCRRAVHGLLAGMIGIAMPASGIQAAGSPAATNALILKNAAAKLASLCRAQGGNPGDMRAAIVSADLTGDGLVEWFIDNAKYRCDGSSANADAGIMYGQAGPPADIESGSSDGRSRQIFDQVVFGLKLERTGGKPTVWVSVGGRYCGQKSLPMGANAWSCELPLRWNAAARQLQIAPPGKARKLERTD